MMKLEEIKKTSFVFIVGAARSGTTLLQMILDAHPSVIFPTESKLIVHLKQKYFKVTNWTEELIDEFIIDLYKERTNFAKFWSISPDKLRENIKSFPVNKLSFEALCKMVYMHYPSPFIKQKITLIGDKNPDYSAFINELLEVFPNSKFIHIVRDYRDNVVSNKQTFGVKNVNVLAQHWKIFNEMIEISKKNKRVKFYELRYEDLVTNPEYSVSEICKFLDLEFKVEMLNYSNRVKIEEVKEVKKQHLQVLEEIHPNILKPISALQINKWEKNLSNDELELIDYICGDFAKKYDYIRQTRVKKWNYFIKSYFGFCKIYSVIYVKKIYYKMPFWIRDSIRVVSQKLYDWFKFSTHYNNHDFHFKD